MASLNLNSLGEKNRQRDKLHNLNGRMFQFAMWYECLMVLRGVKKTTQTGEDKRWLLEIGRMTEELCLRHCRVNLYLSRRLNRRPLTTR